MHRLRWTLPLVATLVVAASAALPSTAPALVGLFDEDPAQVGAWSEPIDSPVEAVHMAMLPTGKVLLFSNSASAHLFDPATERFEPAPFEADYTIFCSGHAFLPDGRLLVIGGNAPEEVWFGPREVAVFDPWTETWSAAAPMHQGRYYPTAATLADGRVIALSGNDGAGFPAEVVEVYDADANTWTVLDNAVLEQEMYPRVHVVPGGELVRVGQEPETLTLDASDPAASWQPGPVASAQRWGSASVLLPDGERILHVAGQSGGFGGEGWQTGPLRDSPAHIAEHVLEGTVQANPGHTAEVLDLETATWTRTGDLTFPRRDVSAVLMADGSVLAVNGGLGYEALPGWVDHTLAPERYDDATGSWELMAQQGLRRGYHSTAVLLPDGRVLVGGGDFELNNHAHPPEGVAHRHDDPVGLATTLELYSPPYLFAGERPSVLSVPEVVGFGGTFAVTTHDAATIETVALVRLGSVTHSVNTDQRYVSLAFERFGDALVVEGPADGGVAVPGAYMLVVVDEAGVPSVGRSVSVG